MFEAVKDQITRSRSIQQDLTAQEECSIVPTAIFVNYIECMNKDLPTG